MLMIPIRQVLRGSIFLAGFAFYEHSSAANGGPQSIENHHGFGDVIIGEHATIQQEGIRPLTVGTASSSTLTGRKKRAAFDTNARLWDNNIVVYSLENVAAYPSIKKAFLDAISHIKSHVPGLRFVERRNEAVYINVVLAYACGYSDVGKQNKVQALGIGLRCGNNMTGQALHELGHALGLKHEQQRPDRAKHVIISKHLALSQPIVSSIDTRSAYDYHSIMHYNTQSGIQTRDHRNQSFIGQRQRLSDGDIAELKRLYPHHNRRRETSSIGAKFRNRPGSVFLNSKQELAHAGKERAAQLPQVSHTGQLLSRESGKCLAALDDSQSYFWKRGERSVGMRVCRLNEPTQQWSHTVDGPITNSAYAGMCLAKAQWRDATPVADDERSHVALQQCNRLSNQRWVFDRQIIKNYADRRLALMQQSGMVVAEHGARADDGRFVWDKAIGIAINPSNP